MNVDKFVNMRTERINDIEIAKELYKKIGEALSSIHRKIFDENAYADGCIYQFFCWAQRISSRLIFSNFCSIIGSYDTKNDCLKSWLPFQLSTQNIELLKAIRSRYSPIRNNLIAHISLSFQANDGISIIQIEEDINHIRNLLNTIRELKGIPTLIQSYNANDHYAVQGIQMLFERLLIQSGRQTAEGYTEELLK